LTRTAIVARGAEAPALTRCPRAVVRTGSANFTKFAEEVAGEMPTQ
jgi:hypothetical protein